MFDAIINTVTSAAQAAAPYLPYAAAAVGGAAVTAGVIYGPAAVEAVGDYLAERKAEAEVSDEIAAFHATAS